MSKGFVLYASGEEYIRQAYLCALSIKSKNNSYPISLLTNSGIENKNNIYDNVITIPWQTKDESRFQISNRWKTYHATPYDETIVMDVDTLVTQNIDSWWNFFSNYELFFPTKVYNYRHEVATSRRYRKAFDANHLPDIYTGIHYFKKCDLAHTFFKWLELISNNWELFYGKYCTEHYPRMPSMDLSTAIVVKILELDETVTNNKIDFLRFVHMKKHLQNWTTMRSTWLRQVGVYITPDLDLLIGNYLQTGIFHYVEKDFVTDDIISAYEDKVL